MSEDVLLIRSTKILMFYNVKTQKEDNIIVVGGNKLTPSVNDYNLPLDSIGCVECCGTNLLAFTEEPPIVKIVVCRYPDLKILAILIGKYDK